MSDTTRDDERDEPGAGSDEPGSDDAGPESDAGPVETADPAEVERLSDRVLRGLGLELSTKARDAGATIEVQIEGADSDYLLDHEGEALNALQYLLNRIIYRGRKGKKIHVDSDGFRKVREDELVEMARKAAEKVKADGEESVLQALNPYERRLVHLAVAEIEGVATRSIGDGFLKRVAIVPADKGGDRKRRPRADS